MVSRSTQYTSMESTNKKNESKLQLTIGEIETIIFCFTLVFKFVSKYDNSNTKGTLEPSPKLNSTDLKSRLQSYQIKLVLKETILAINLYII